MSTATEPNTPDSKPAAVDDTLLPAGGASDVKQTLAAYWTRVKGGDMGSLPALLAIAVLTLVFSQKDKSFLTVRNIANLTQQAAPLMVFTCALVFLLILTELDLSAGVTGGTAMALFVNLTKSGWGWGWALLFSFAVGIVTGLVIGTFVAKIGIPAFVVTLGFFLGYQGVMLVLLEKTGDGAGGGLFRIETKALKRIMNDNFSPALSWVIVVVVAVISIALAFYDRARRTSRDLPNVPLAVTLIKLAVPIGLCAVAVAFLNVNRASGPIPVRGVPIVVPIVMLILFIGQFVLQRTRFGLHLYAVGGNPEAARRAGINVTRMRIAGFLICSTLAVIGGLFHAARVGTVEATAGRQVVLEAVGAAVVGGVSLFGGRGNLKNAAMGAFAIAMITNGLGLLGLAAGVNYIVTGSVLLLAATVDALSRKRSATSSIAR